ncbi:LysR family transcriptional regulator [Hamadaea tsunoensis]|uniref:LysR family transcriptional regulator n=1 Tax=Hamadaea tsunoensis TaxID=53368 RepID=UPI0004200D10|nr:LysR substrate-binding domain-containing protein [Hamadaea tsunoensis]
MNRGDGVDPRLLRYFLTLAEELHFTRAAARLFVSQPALSNQIRLLETRVGAVLFTRTRHGVELTAEGERFRPYARQAVAAIEAGLHAIGARELRVDVLDGELRLPRRVLSALRAREPGVVVRITALGRHRQRLHAGDLDAAFTGPGLEARGSGSPGGDDGLATEHVADEPVDVLLPATHALAAHDEIALSDLAAEMFYLPADDLAPEWNAFVRTACGFTPRRHPVTADGASAALDLVAEGACITVGLRSTAYPPGVVRRPVAGGLAYPWTLVWRAGDPAVEPLRAACLAVHSPGGADPDRPEILH